MRILEGLYYAAGVVLAGVAFTAISQIKLLKAQVDQGVTQLRLLKADMVTRNDRAAKEYALETAFRYAKCIEMFGDARQRLAEDGYPPRHIGDPSDFSWASVSPAFRQPETVNQRTVMVSPLNELEAIAATFTSGLADESVVFAMMGQSFCGIVSQDYDVISRLYSKDNSTFYSNIIALYRTWSAKLSKQEIAAARTNLAAREASIVDQPLPPVIGPFPAES